MCRNLIKPTFDRLTAIVAFLILSPVFVAVTIFLALANNGKPTTLKYERCVVSISKNEHYRTLDYFDRDLLTNKQLGHMNSILKDV